jgi:hypothetical protein
MAIITEENFKGHPLLVIKKDENDTWPLKIGVKKARLIVASIDDIAEFIEKNSPPQEG